MSPPINKGSIIQLWALSDFSNGQELTGRLFLGRGIPQFDVQFAQLGFTHR
jgi:hypothetical protein